MNDQENEKFAQQLKSTLDKSVIDLDENVRCKLQIARGEILNKEINSWLNECHQTSSRRRNIKHSIS